MPQIVIIDGDISREELKKHLLEDTLVKAVVDVDLGIMAVGGEMHADEEQVLLEKNSKQENLWGINLYPDKEDESWIEFDSMINLRPMHDNRTRGVDNPERQEKIRLVVTKLVTS